MPDLKSNSSISTTTTNASPSSHLSVVLALITLAQFMIVVDATIVQVALPSIGKEFDVSVNGLQWIVTAYGLTLAGFLMLSGRIGDIYGYKKLFIIGVLLFSLASLIGGLAPSEIVLILARVVQGLGAAMASATGLSILAATFPEGKQRNRALSVFSAATGSGFAAGMILRGVITAILGWRWLFDINVPIGIVVSLLSIKYVSTTTKRTHQNRHPRYFWGSFSNSWVDATCLFCQQCTEYWHRIPSNAWASIIFSHSPNCLCFDRISLKGACHATWISTKRLNFWSKCGGPAPSRVICRNDIYSDELSSAGTRLLCIFQPALHSFLWVLYF